MTRVVVAITGASGVIHGVRLLEVLRPLAEVEVHLVISDAGKRTVALETDRTIAEIEALADRVYNNGDIAAAVASGSYRFDAVVVVPCSMKTLSGIANSYADTLVVRAAEVALKERRRLVLVPRETPLHLGHLRLLVAVAELGAVVVPPMPAFYQHPETVAEIVDQTVAKVVDLLGLDAGRDLVPRWTGPPSRG
ncbi:MAG TPA: UbiX family flavin prenyltransferase [Candidatus Sulfomarinibacteraceae bacterium]|nr:UbiX family flavin prenyltransferase [Candidatus Sulfomarinibacteraceae bacterium]